MMHNVKNFVRYRSKIDLSCMATSGQGFIATGSETGQIRLYDQINKRAKTLLPGLGQHIKYMETTEDGKWILCTCQDYIMVIPTTMENSEYTGFERRMGKQKPRPYVLRLKNQDIVKYNLTKAHFNTGENTEEEQEQWIVTSTDPFIIKWNFRHLKKNGVVNDYQIRQGKSNIVHNVFRHNFDNDVLVSETDSVYIQHSHKTSN
jgi:VID27-like protein